MNTEVVKKERIFGLDVLRAIAILLVLFSHTTLLWSADENNSIIQIIQFFGTIGVDIFFVLSGFLIGNIIIRHIEKKEIGLKPMLYFWIRRWLRTLPNYFLILIINIVLVLFLKQEHIEGVFQFFYFFQNFNHAQTDFFTESWSLSIEEFAYILGPLLLLFFYVFTKKLSGKMYLSVTVIIILMFTAFRLYFHYENTLPQDASWSKHLRKVVIYRIDTIYYGFIGAYLAYYFKHIWLRFKRVSFVIGFVLFVSTHLYIMINDLQPNTSSFFFNVLYLSLVSISILLTLPVFSTWTKQFKLSKIITKISLWSYALYLVNYSIVLLTLQHFMDVSEMSYISKSLVVIMFWVISFWLSYVLYAKYEKPMMDLRDSLKVRKRFT